MAILTYVYKYDTNLNLEIVFNQTSGSVTFQIRNTQTNNVVATFTGQQLEKLQALVEEFKKLRNNNDLQSVTIA